MAFEEEDGYDTAIRTKQTRMITHCRLQLSLRLTWSLVVSGVVV